MFERVIAGKDVATGTSIVGSSNYTGTVGTPTSTFREGNATVQFEVVSSAATYNTTTGAPNPVANGTTTTAAAVEARSGASKRSPARGNARRGQKKGRMNKSALMRQSKRWI